MSTVVTQLLADYIVTAELEGDRVICALDGQQERALTAEITLKSGVWDGQLYALFICYNVYFLIQF